jgi:hypothetical protein
METRIASFNYLELELPIDIAENSSHPGPCDDDVLEAMENPFVKDQLDRISPTQLIKELSQYGAWTEEELSNHYDNLMRIVWLAAGNIMDEVD